MWSIPAWESRRKRFRISLRSCIGVKTPLASRAAAWDSDWWSVLLGCMMAWCRYAASTTAERFSPSGFRSRRMSSDVSKLIHHIFDLLRGNDKVLPDFLYTHIDKQGH